MAAEKAPAMRRTNASVQRFLAGVPGERRREDALRLCAMTQDITGEPPVMWGTSIIGFGTYRYRYASGHEGAGELLTPPSATGHISGRRVREPASVGAGAAGPA